ncbi:MAG: FHA domain-containing protein [Deltaproteobacteria bacterium]|nr:FHA domain-containing protein [Deltaproteobacteria bacterium]
MADKDKRGPVDDAPEDGTLIDTEMVGDAVYEQPAPEPTVTVDSHDDVRADDGDQTAGDEPPTDPEPDDESTVMVDIESTESEEDAEEEDEDENAKTVLIESPFMDEAQPPEPEARCAQLVVTFGNDSGKEFPVTGDVVVVGRSLDVDIVLNDPSVSRRHFEIHFVDGDWLLKDLGSVNGTKIDGKRVEGQSPLAEGNQIEAGQSLMEFRCEDGDKTRVLELPEEPTPDEATVISDASGLESVGAQPSPGIEGRIR